MESCLQKADPETSHPGILPLAVLCSPAVRFTVDVWTAHNNILEAWNLKPDRLKLKLLLCRLLTV